MERVRKGPEKGLMQVSVQLQPTANRIYNSYVTNARHL